MHKEYGTVDIESNSKESGIVKWFNNSKGYGFIQQEVGPDVFAHHTHIICEGYRSLDEGQVVEFNLIKGDKGLQARNIVALGTTVEVKDLSDQQEENLESTAQERAESMEAVEESKKVAEA